MRCPTGLHTVLLLLGTLKRNKGQSSQRLEAGWTFGHVSQTVALFCLCNL